MVQARRLDREAVTADCRFIIRSENEEETVESSKAHMHDVHGKNHTDEELRSEVPKIV